MMIQLTIPLSEKAIVSRIKVTPFLEWSKIRCKTLQFTPMTGICQMMDSVHKLI